MKKEKTNKEKEMGYEIIIAYFVAKGRYDSYVKWGYVDEFAENMTAYMQDVVRHGMEDINVEVYREVFGPEEDPENNIGVPFGFVYHKNASIPWYVVFYVNFEENKIFSKVIKTSLYHEYMKRMHERVEQFVSPGISIKES